LDISLFPYDFLAVLSFRCGAAIEPLCSLLPVLFGLLYVEGLLAGSENSSRQTARLDDRACVYEPRPEKAGPSLSIGMSKDRETLRDIISAGRRDKS
jgi:hypothetical protein